MAQAESLIRAVARAEVAQAAADAAQAAAQNAWAAVRRAAEAAARPTPETISAGEAARITGRSSRTIRRDARENGWGEQNADGEWRFVRAFIVAQYPPK